MSLDPCRPKVATVILGEDQPVSVTLVDSTTKLPFDLSSATEIIALFQNLDLSILQKKKSTGGIVLLSGPGGAFQILLTAAETALLAPSPTNGYSDLEVKVTIAGKLTIIQLPQSLKVLPRIFPSA